MTTLLNCPTVQILTGLDAITSSGPALVSNYRDLERQYATYDAVESTFTDYNDIMTGHPGYPGGPSAPGSKGAGLHLGIVDEDGVEWWTTDVEGWDDGALVEPTVVQSTLMGAWVDRVRGKSREVTFKATLVAPDVACLAAAKRRAIAALASPPHTGLVRIGGLDLPVAAVSLAKTKLLGDLALEFELTVQGRNLGTPGLGVFREGVSRDYTVTAPGTVDIEYNSTIAGRPVLVLEGPFDAGITISDGVGIVELASPVPSGEILLIDCVTWQISLAGRPARHMITSRSRPLEFAFGGGELTVTGTGSISLSFTITEVW